MSQSRVLYVCHNHPGIRSGGAELYTLDLYEAMRASGKFMPLLLARMGRPHTSTTRYHPGTHFAAVNSDPNQYFLHTDLEEFDSFRGSLRNKSVVTGDLRVFLEAHRPDVVHFQHTIYIGYDAVRVVRNALPNVPIIYTLHEYWPICHRGGQLLRAWTDEPCLEESPRRCNECFPEISPQDFFMRKRFIQSQFQLVDLFVAPSRFLRDRYVHWGLPRDRILVEENGHLRGAKSYGAAVEGKPNRLGFFGQLSHPKGILVLLEAMKLLGADTDAHLIIHGENLELQPEQFQERFGALLQAAGDRVTFAGRYERADLPALMNATDWVIVPSIWWENSPLVIQEAFLHGRPVICSDIGAMAEKVTDGVNGLHFKANDPNSLRGVITRAVEDRSLWSELQGGIPEVHGMDNHVRRLTHAYEGLIESKARGASHPPAGQTTKQVVGASDA